MIHLLLACVPPGPSPTDTGPVTTASRGPHITLVDLGCTAATHNWRVWADALGVDAELRLPEDDRHPLPERHPLSVLDLDPAGLWSLLGVDLEPSPDAIPGLSTRWDCDELVARELAGVRVALLDAEEGALLECWSPEGGVDTAADVDGCLDGPAEAR